MVHTRGDAGMGSLQRAWLGPRPRAEFTPCPSGVQGGAISPTWTARIDLTAPRPAGARAGPGVVEREGSYV